MPVIPELGNLRQKDHEFETNVFYIVRAHLKMRDRESFYINLPY